MSDKDGRVQHHIINHEQEKELIKDHLGAFPDIKPDWSAWAKLTSVPEKLRAVFGSHCVLSTPLVNAEKAADAKKREKRQEAAKKRQAAKRKRDAETAVAEAPIKHEEPPVSTPTMNSQPAEKTIRMPRPKRPKPAEVVEDSEPAPVCKSPFLGLNCFTLLSNRQCFQARQNLFRKSAFKLRFQTCPCNKLILLAASSPALLPSLVGIRNAFCTSIGTNSSSNM